MFSSSCALCSNNYLTQARYSICLECYESGKNMLTFINDIDEAANSATTDNPTGLITAVKWVNENNERLTFLSNFATAFRDKIHPDIEIKPNIGPSIYAHRALLSVRSDILKHILGPDVFKPVPTADVISFPELSYEELDSLLEFLYTGTLSKEKSDKHVYSLLRAAEKYEIEYLKKFCENHMMRNLNVLNVFDVFEISHVCSSEKLKEVALNFIVKNMKDTVFSDKFDTFALNNPHLVTNITRSSILYIKSGDCMYTVS